MKAATDFAIMTAIALAVVVAGFLGMNIGDE